MREGLWTSTEVYWGDDVMGTIFIFRIYSVSIIKSCEKKKKILWTFDISMVILLLKTNVKLQKHNEQHNCLNDEPFLFCYWGHYILTIRKVGSISIYFIYLFFLLEISISSWFQRVERNDKLSG